MKQKTRAYFGDLILLAVAIIWGLGFIAVKIGLNNGLSPFFLMFLRFSVASVVLLPFQIKNIRNINIRTYKSGVILGILIFLGFTFQTLGLDFTTTSKNAFLTGVNVVIVPFLAAFLTKRKVDGKSIAAALLCLIGIGLLTLNDSFTINIGDLLTLICAFMFALHITVTSIIAKDESTISLVWLQMTVAAILSFVFAIVFKEQFILNTSSILSVLYLGIFSTMLAFFLQTFGQKFAHATKAAIILSMESLFGAILAVIFFNDILAPQMIIGCILIFLALVMVPDTVNTANKCKQIDY